jgi:hypothetical protein
MTTIVNGVEITPRMAEALKEWYDPENDESLPEVFVAQISEAQDCLTRILIDAEQVSSDIIKIYIGELIYMKDCLSKFIPVKGGRP